MLLMEWRQSLKLSALQMLIVLSSCFVTQKIEALQQQQLTRASQNLGLPYLITRVTQKLGETRTTTNTKRHPVARCGSPNLSMDGPNSSPNASPGNDADNMSPSSVERKHFFSQKSWSDLKPVPSADLMQQLSGTVAGERPSRIQASLWHELHSEEVSALPSAVLVADATGSGKTLAYLLPIIEGILRDAKAEALLLRRHEPTDLGPEKVGGARRQRQRKTMNGRVRALILCPTTELAVQVGSVARAVAQARRCCA